MVPLINGKAYDFGSIVCTILGVPIAGITKIMYSQTQEKQDNFGSGYNPVSRGYGKKEATCSISLSMNEIAAIRAAAPNRSLLDIPSFDITVTFLNAQLVITDVIKNCEFKSDKYEGAQGDMDANIDLDLICSHIEFSA